MHDEGAVAEPAILPIELEKLLAEGGFGNIKGNQDAAVPEAARRCRKVFFFVRLDDVAPHGAEDAIGPNDSVELRNDSVFKGHRNAVL
jgi:hypothetical protein